MPCRQLTSGPDAGASATEDKMLFWLDNHARQRAWGAPVSKLHSAGLQLLQPLGWQQGGRVHSVVPGNLHCTTATDKSQLTGFC
jgi:hypothetical protein